ncbi:hypothetical protein J3459_008599 [Metarhizium acridum]|uniref:uncharacterized protein n=1 Tax=Metarhizium acridum TaxID=92637 RepID=UPI001C6CA986|nr:hypothetical protein J3458_002665 [Metarhizium acridum]KAG8425907.1 hypothetical protein J3459_008599 [Metarhizium acridum]
MLTTVITKGLGRHLEDLSISPDEARYYQALALMIHEHTYTLAITAAQLSLLALFYRVFKSVTWAKITIYTLATFVSVWCLVRLFIAVFQCFPPNFLWDKSIEGSCTIDPAQFFLWSVSAHLVIDVALMVLPATQISRLFLPWPQKLAIAAMFMFGVAVVIAASMTLAASSRYDSYADDVLWNCTPALVWSAVEIHLSVMACCLPVMRPVIHALGGWWGHNFSSRKEASAPTYNTVKLGHVHRSAGVTYGNESTCNFANGSESSQTAGVTDSGRIFGQGEGSDTVIISTGKDKEKLSSSTSTGSADGAIMVQYEIDLSFSRQGSHGQWRGE